MRAEIERSKEEAVIALDKLKEHSLGSDEYKNLVVTATNLLEQVNSAERYDTELEATIEQAKISDEATRYKADAELEAAKYRADTEHAAAIEQAKISDEAMRYKAELELEAAKYRADAELEAAKAKTEAEKEVGIEKAKTDRWTATLDAGISFIGTVCGVGTGAIGAWLGYVALDKTLRFEQTGAVTSKSFQGALNLIKSAFTRWR